MQEPVKAEGLIWLIVGVFWVIAQIAGAAAKKGPAANRRFSLGSLPAIPFEIVER